MDPEFRQVARLPLEELWDEDGRFGRRLRHLTRDQIRDLIKQEPVRFVAANLAEPLRWTAVDECYDQWKAIKGRVADPDGFRLEDFPDDFVYIASEWEGRLGERLVVLEVHH